MQISMMHLAAAVFLSTLNHVLALESGLFSRNVCPCAGHNLTFECTVSHGSIGGTTLWKGEVIRNCCMIPEVFLRHRDFMQGTSQTCDNGDVILNVYSLQVEGMDDSNYSSYTSQLNITYSTNLIGSTVICEYDNGTQVTPIGSKIITSNAKFYPPPADNVIRFSNIDQYQFITFVWNPTTPECSAFYYRIVASDCGICPSTTVYNTAICVLNHVSITISLCSFAVQSEFCGEINTGNISEPIQAMFKVLEPPLIYSVQHRYSYLTGDAIGFLVEFNDLPSFSISDGIDGSALSYTLVYNNSESGDGCGSATIPASFCVDRACKQPFTYEESNCSSPSTDINITISATNVLGIGPSSEAITVHSSRNTVFNVTFNLSSSSVVCTFFNQQAHTKFCHIEYGSKQDGCDSSLTSKSTQDSDSNIVSINLPSHFFSNGYCFKVKGYDGTHTAFVEGTYIPGIPNQDQMQAPDRDLGVAIVVTVVSIMVTLISSGAIIVIVLLMFVRAKRRIQRSPSTCVNSPIYEEPDHHVNVDHSITISDNAAYSVINLSLKRGK